MEITFTIHYHETVVQKDIPKLSTSVKNQLKQSIEKKLMTRPELFGKPLRQSAKGYRKLRVGDYRIIFYLEKNRVKILMIEHQAKVYKLLQNRIASSSNPFPST